MPNDTDNLEAAAYDATAKAAWRIAKDTIAAVVEHIEWHATHECKPSDFDGDTDAARDEFNDELHDWIHEACDNAMIYTRDQWICAWGLRDADDAEEFDTGETLEERLTARAYCNLRAAVCDASEIEEAIDAQVARLCPEEAAETHEVKP